MLGRILLRGLLAVLPIVVTVALLWWLFEKVESAFAFLLRPLLEERYVPGMGLALGLIVVFFVGVAMSTWIVRRLVKWGERQLLKLPLIKTLYGSVQDMLSLFAGSQKQQFNKVVTVTWGDRRFLGFVTREHFDDLPDAVGGAGDVAVYLPMSYQLGGFTLMVPRDQVTPVEMSLEEAMKFAITAGVTATPDEDEKVAAESGVKSVRQGGDTG